MFKKKPYFIVFEGIEGSGKSYQCKKLFKNLKKKGYDVLLTREPGGTANAEKIRKLILTDYFVKNKNKNFDRYTDTLLYLAARNEHVKNKILPALKKKQIVICDRFIDSTISYQVYGKKVKQKFIENIHNEILKNLRPNLTFILKVNLKSSRKRLSKRKKRNRYDNFSNKFYQIAQKGFLYKKNNKKKYIIFDSSENTPRLEKKILEIVLKRLQVRVSK
tara:strand:+ start:973 stop:1629 length:657 start_codon:yes stop_codon:yes gene_type:complete